MTPASRLGWVWPPVVLALAVLDVRPGAPGTVRPRSLAALPGRRRPRPRRPSAPLSRTSPRSATSTLRRPGQTYDVGGHRLHLDCRGHGGPTVVLFNGLGEISASWARIADRGRAARPGSAPTTAPDRAGATSAAHPQDGVEPRPRPAPAARRGRRDRPLRAGRPLHRRHLRDDATPPATPSRSPAWCCWTAPAPTSSPRSRSYAGQYAVMRRGLALLPTLARLGLGRLVARAPHLPGRPRPGRQR